nr:MAG TPA: hypothetical protein [Caudoviricetes sp.]
MNRNDCFGFLFYIHFQNISRHTNHKKSNLLQILDY